MYDEYYGLTFFNAFTPSNMYRIFWSLTLKIIGFFRIFSHFRDQIEAVPSPCQDSILLVSYAIENK